MRVLLFGLALALGALAQTAPDFRIGVELVHLDAEVVSKRGQVISGLTAADFRIFDDKQEQKIAAFGAEEQPLEILLLIDTSGSMRNAVVKVAEASQRALKELRPGDSVAVVTFNDRVTVITRFTTSLKNVQDSLELVARLPFGGATFIQDAVQWSAKQFPTDEKQAARRRAVLVITDNIGTPAVKESAVAEDLWASEAVLSGLIVNSGFSNPSRDRGGVDRIVEMTGGETMYADHLGDAFTEMIHRLRTRYSLYYRTPEGSQDGSERKVRIELTKEAKTRFPGAKVLAPHGYRVRVRNQDGHAPR